MINVELLPRFRGKPDCLFIDRGDIPPMALGKPRRGCPQHRRSAMGVISPYLVAVCALVFQIPPALALQIPLAPRTARLNRPALNLLAWTIRPSYGLNRIRVLEAPFPESLKISLPVLEVVIALGNLLAGKAFLTGRRVLSPAPRSSCATVTLESQIVGVAVTILYARFFTAFNGARGGRFPPPHTS